MGWWGNDTAVRFPNLGIEFSNLPRGIEIGSFQIAFYGAIIACGMLAGIAIARWKARKTGQDQEIYLDFALWAIPLSVLGARLYYVIFSWGDGWNFWEIFNLRRGGLAIYGGVIVAILSAIVYSKIKKLRIGLLADTGILGLILGQIMGRWGNFFNREVFGKYTDSLFAMQIDLDCSSLSSDYTMPEALLRAQYVGKEDTLNNILEIRNKIEVLDDGHQYIQVHPTFLYESVWNILILLLMLWAWKRKKFNGEILLIYLAGYGFGRFFIEGIRTDQLYIWGTGLAVSQVLSALLFFASITLLIVFRVRAVKSGEAQHVTMELCKVVKSVKPEDASEEKTEGADENQAADSLDVENKEDKEEVIAENDEKEDTGGKDLKEDEFPGEEQIETKAEKEIEQE